MKTDQQLFQEFREKNRTPRLFTEAQILQLMEKARKEVINDNKSRIPTMETLQKEFNETLEKTMNDPTLVACYKRLTWDKLKWVWFTHGAAAALKKFKNAK